MNLANLAHPQTLSRAGLEVGALLALWHPEASETRCMLTLVLGHKGMAPSHSMPFAQADKLPLLARHMSALQASRSSTTAIGYHAFGWEELVLKFVIGGNGCLDLYVGQLPL